MAPMTLAEKISRQWEIAQTNEPMVFYFHNAKIAEEVTKKVGKWCGN